MTIQIGDEIDQTQLLKRRRRNAHHGAAAHKQAGIIIQRPLETSASQARTPKCSLSRSIQNRGRSSSKEAVWQSSLRTPTQVIRTQQACSRNLTTLALKSKTGKRTTHLTKWETLSSTMNGQNVAQTGFSKSTRSQQFPLDSPTNLRRSEATSDHPKPSLRNSRILK
jgi:hypothetical protein